MWYRTYTQINDSQLLVVGGQIGNLTHNPSFGHKLCLKYSNGSCKPILDIYVPRDLQFYRNFLIQWVLTLVIAFWKFIVHQCNSLQLNGDSTGIIHFWLICNKFATTPIITCWHDISSTYKNEFYCFSL